MCDPFDLKSLCVKIKKTVSRELLSANFKSFKNKFYYKEINDVVCVVDLQKSNYSHCYYMNIGIWYKILGEYYLVPTYKCHSYFRVGTIPDLNDQERILDKFLDAENYYVTGEDISKCIETNLNALKVFINEKLLPCLQKFSKEYFFERYCKKERWFSTTSELFSRNSDLTHDPDNDLQGSKSK